MLQLERLLPSLAAPCARPGPRKLLVVNGHPETEQDGFCGDLCDAYEEGARAGGADVERLGAAAFASAEALAKIRWARHLAIMFPLQDDRPPGGLRCLFERYARLETLDAFRPVEHSVRTVVLMEFPAFAHRALLKNDNNPSALRRSISLPGLFSDDQVFIGGVHAISAKQRTGWLRDMYGFGLRSM